MRSLPHGFTASTVPAIMNTPQLCWTSDCFKGAVFSEGKGRDGFEKLSLVPGLPRHDKAMVLLLYGNVKGAMLPSPQGCVFGAALHPPE